MTAENVCHAWTALEHSLTRVVDREIDRADRRRVAELSGGTFRTELHDVVANDEHVAALFTARAGRSGRQLEDRIVEVLHIRDGKVAEAWIYPADLYVSDEFWS